MPANTIQELAQSLELPNKVQLFQVTLNGQSWYFTNAIKVSGETVTPVWWNGHKYDPFPVSIAGLGYTKDNSQERSKIMLSNVKQAYSLLFASIPRLDGGQLTYIETYEDYISNSAVGNSSIFIHRGFYIFSKFLSKNKYQILYEIAHRGDIEYKQLPNRRILREGKLGLRFEGAGMAKTRN